MPPQSPVVAIAGATGAVGQAFLDCLAQRRFPLRELRLLASARSVGKTMKFAGQDLAVRELTEENLKGVDIALFSAGSGPSKQFAAAVVKSGGIVVDNSSAFRMDPDVPLVIPEVNADAIKRHKGIVANPNCSAIISMTPLWPVHCLNPLKRVVISTYQAASGAGAAAMEELRESTKAYLEGRDFTPKVLPHPYAFNVFSHNTAVDPATGYNDEETKVMREARKIFSAPDLAISATCIRVPVLRAHACSVTFECEQPISPTTVRDLLAKAPGIKLVDDAARNYFPMPRDASGQDDILVGRIRQDLSDPRGHSISLFTSGDQLLKGAALNAVQIAERLL